MIEQSSLNASRPRYTERPFPPYSYVPGQAPHPVSDPAGHMHGVEQTAIAPLQPDDWRDSAEYLYGVDLFNHAFYWEAHEAWEALWHAAGRSGLLADFLKGLIKLAAAGVKAREGKPTGVQRHATRSIELISTATQARDGCGATYCGIDLGNLIASVDAMVDRLTDGHRTTASVEFPIAIELDWS